MREFPSKFVSKNLSQFPQYKYDRDVCYLREAIYEHFLADDEKSKVSLPFETPFDLISFERNRNPPRYADMVAKVSQELEVLGWKVTLGHKNSMLWMYPPENPPKSLPDW